MGREPGDPRSGIDRLGHSSLVVTWGTGCQLSQLVGSLASGRLGGSDLLRVVRDIVQGVATTVSVWACSSPCAWS
jgi:hypothetical protein